MTMTRREMTEMCFTATKRATTKWAQKADAERYQRYANAKSRIPMNLPPKEYEAEVKRLARRYHV